MMDWFSTALALAGIKEPDDRIIDGVSLLPVLMNGTVTNRYVSWTLLLFDASSFIPVHEQMLMVSS